LLDGEDLDYVKFYQNGDEVFVWELADDGDLPREFEQPLELESGDQLRLKLFGAEKLVGFEIGPGDE
jgi:hypothetical protein